MDQDGYHFVTRNRTLGNYMPEIFAVDRFTDRGVKIDQTLSGSSGSRIKVSSTCCERAGMPAGTKQAASGGGWFKA